VEAQVRRLGDLDPFIRPEELLTPPVEDRPPPDDGDRPARRRL
jgi:hypothetical protein